MLSLRGLNFRRIAASVGVGLTAGVAALTYVRLFPAMAVAALAGGLVAGTLGTTRFDEIPLESFLASMLAAASLCLALLGYAAVPNGDPVFGMNLVWTGFVPYLLPGYGAVGVLGALASWRLVRRVRAVLGTVRRHPARPGYGAAGSDGSGAESRSRE